MLIGRALSADGCIEAKNVIEIKGDFDFLSAILKKKFWGAGIKTHMWDAKGKF